MGDTTIGGSSTAHPLEKFFRFLPLILAGAGIFWFWGSIVPFVLETIKNTWLTVAYGVPLVAVLLYVWSNPNLIWMGYKTICRKITEFFVRLDPLSVMDRYVDLLKIKRENLNKTIVVLSGKKTNLQRQISTLEETIETNKREGSAAIKLNDQRAASSAGSKIATDAQTVKMFQPILNRMEANLKFLSELSENWKYSIETLTYTIDRKRQEYIMLKETAKALNQAKEFANGDTEAAQLYQMSVKALEDSVTQKIASIEQFEKDSKDVMASINIQKQVRTDEGMKTLEDYIKSNELKMPDFNNVTTFTNVDAETIPYQDSVPTSKKFNLLKK